MSYQGISVREALDKLNAPNNGWFLPQVQRQYVWGTRYESEDYICLLLDSLLKHYPIGGVVLWETEQAVLYRRFINDYAPGQYARQTDEGVWGAPKALVAAGDDEDANLRIRENLSALWDIFVETDHKSIAYFSVKADTPEKVNEVFRRLNTGGIALTQLELVLGKIKAVQSDYEEKLWDLADKIEKKSGGIKFSSASIL